MRLRKPIKGTRNSFEIAGIKFRLKMIAVVINPFHDRIMIKGDMTQIGEDIVKRVLKNRRKKK